MKSPKRAKTGLKDPKKGLLTRVTEHEQNTVRPNLRKLAYSNDHVP